MDPSPRRPVTPVAAEPPRWPVYVLVVVLGLLTMLLGLITPSIAAFPLGVVTKALPGVLFPGEPAWRLAAAQHLALAAWAVTQLGEAPLGSSILILGGYVVTWALVAIGRWLRLRRLDAA